MTHLIACAFILVVLVSGVEAKERERVFSIEGQTINQFNKAGILQSSTHLDRERKLREKRYYDTQGKLIRSDHFDDQGHLWWRVSYDPNGFTRKSTFKKNGKLFEEVTYNENGKPIGYYWPTTGDEPRFRQDGLCLIHQENLGQVPFCNSQIKISPAR